MYRFRVHVFAVVSLLLVTGHAFGQDTSFGFGGDACGGRVRADPGSTVTSTIDCVLTTENNASDRGVQGWSLSIAGDGLLITDITANCAH